MELRRLAGSCVVRRPSPGQLRDEQVHGHVVSPVQVPAVEARHPGVPHCVLQLVVFLYRWDYYFGYIFCRSCFRQDSVNDTLEHQVSDECNEVICDIVSMYNQFQAEIRISQVIGPESFF